MYRVALEIRPNVFHMKRGEKVNKMYTTYQKEKSIKMKKSLEKVRVIFFLL